MKMVKEKWGFLRETTEAAIKAGIDRGTGLHRTGLNEYLKVIFPDVDDWVHDKALGVTVNNKVCRKRPDYRSEKLKIIVEFDGIQHYTMPDRIQKDIINTQFYESLGYKVVRIPYFIQLTNKAVKYFFNVDVKEPLFNENIHSMDKNDRNTPAFLCGAGVLRMIEEFKHHPEQYRVNKEFLMSQNDQFLTGVDLI